MSQSVQLWRSVAEVSAVLSGQKTHICVSMRSKMNVGDIIELVEIDEDRIRTGYSCTLLVRYVERGITPVFDVLSVEVVGTVTPGFPESPTRGQA